MKTIKRIGILFLVLAVCAVTAAWVYTYIEIPDKYYTAEGADLNIISSVPVTATADETTENGYTVEVRLLGIVPVKTVSVRVVKPQSVVPGGQPFGVRLYTEGCVVIATDEVNGAASPAAQAGVKVGDVIRSVDGQAVISNTSLADAVQAKQGESITLTLTRDGKEKTVTVTPQYDGTTYRIGLWVRDSISGIGTVTYYDTQNGVFAALGHSITDSETGIILPILTGDVFAAEVTGVVKGKSGTPGELKGMFLEYQRIGTLYKNTGEGVFGQTESTFSVRGSAVEIAYKQDVKVGGAQILCTVDGDGVKAYDVQIEHVTLNTTQTTKNMIIRVTDPELLETTGGIVQGMSGSPILQDGKLIGAVTHVLVSAPDTGYGIFIENMIDVE